MVINYANLCRLADFPCSPASLDIPKGVHKAGRTNMVFKHGIYRGEITTSQLLPFELRSHGSIHNCDIWITGRVLGKCQHLTFLGTFAMVFPM